MFDQKRGVPVFDLLAHRSVRQVNHWSIKA